VDEQWHVSTIAYDYRVGRADGGRELLSWHPTTGVSFPRFVAYRRWHG